MTYSKFKTSFFKVSVSDKLKLTSKILVDLGQNNWGQKKPHKEEANELEVERCGGAKKIHFIDKYLLSVLFEKAGRQRHR